MRLYFISHIFFIAHQITITLFINTIADFTPDFITSFEQICHLLSKRTYLVSSSYFLEYPFIFGGSGYSGFTFYHLCNQQNI